MTHFNIKFIFGNGNKFAQVYAIAIPRIGEQIEILENGKLVAYNVINVVYTASSAVIKVYLELPIQK